MASPFSFLGRAQNAPHVLACPTKQVSLPMAQVTSKRLGPGHWDCLVATSARLLLAFLISERREASRISSIPSKQDLPGSLGLQSPRGRRRGWGQWPRLPLRFRMLPRLSAPSHCPASAPVQPRSGRGGLAPLPRPRYTQGDAGAVYTGPELGPASPWPQPLTALRTGIPQIFSQIKRTNKLYCKNKQSLFFF